ncbi:unnamed protein product [Trichobilharzia regenti]|nr:unnamed protein product [Trichobilharzia regenti]
MARKHHPDRQKTVEDKRKAEERFRLINTAYEILSDPEQRREYDYMLDNPDQMYYHYYRYYRRQYSAKVDVRLVIISILLIISSIQVSWFFHFCEELELVNGRYWILLLLLLFIIFPWVLGGTWALINTLTFDSILYSLSLQLSLQLPIWFHFILI